MIELNKDLIGKEIWGRTTGNNARNADMIVRFKVLDVKRKYFTLMRYYDIKSDTRSDVDTYCPKTGATKQQVQAGYGLNAGYDFYSTLKEASADIEKSEQLAVILEHSHKLSQLSPEKIQIIFDVVNGEFKNNEVRLSSSL